MPRGVRRQSAAAPASSARRVGSGVLFLSIGTLGVQAMSAVGQFVLAVWLQPIEYGYWATATSVLAILTGLVNLGEISGFLAGESASLSQASWSVLRINVVLALAGSLLAAAFLLRGNIIVGVLLLLASGNLVLLGESNLLYAAFVKSGQRRSLVTAQFVGAAIRLIVGVLVAWATSSAIAFALSMLAYTAVVVVILRIVYDRSGSSPALCPSKFLWRGRTAWAAQSASQMMAGQTDYLVISVVGGPALLGMYFFCYQVTVALGAVLMVPLSRSTLSDLAGRSSPDREVVASQLLGYVLASVGLVCALAAIVAPLAAGFLPVEWQSAAPAIVMLLASMPARFVAPVTDAIQMAAGRWWKITRINVFDALGTGLAGMAAILGDVLLLSFVIVCWKVIAAVLRIGMGLSSTRLRRRIWLAFATMLYAVFIVAAATDAARFGYLGPILAATLAAALLIGGQKS